MITVIMHWEAGEDGDAEPPGVGEDGELVLRHWGRVLLCPVGNQLVEGAGLEAGPGQDVATHCRCLTNENALLIVLSIDQSESRTPDQ